MIDEALNKMYLYFSYLIFPQDETHFEQSISNAMFCSLHSVQQHTISAVQLLVAWTLLTHFRWHFKLLHKVMPLLKSVFGRDTLRLCELLTFSSCFSIYWFFLSELSINLMVTNSDFLITLIFPLLGEILHLFIHLYLYYCGLNSSLSYSIGIILYYHYTFWAQSSPYLDIGRPFELDIVFFWHFSIILWVLSYFLVLKDMLGSSCTSPTQSLERALCLMTFGCF